MKDFIFGIINQFKRQPNPLVRRVKLQLIYYNLKMDYVLY